VTINLSITEKTLKIKGFAESKRSKTRFAVNFSDKKGAKPRTFDKNTVQMQQKGLVACARRF